MPLPFSKAIFLYGEPIEVPRRLTPEQAENYRTTIESKLNELCEQGERDFDALWRSGIKAEEKRK